MMRFIALAAVLASLPLFFALLRSNQSWRNALFFALGLFPFVSQVVNMDASIIAWPLWPAPARGITISFLDTLALAIVLTQPRQPASPWLKLLAILYLVQVLLSAFSAHVWMPSVFYAFQVARVMLVYAAVVRLGADFGAIRRIYMGISAGILVNAVVALSQRASGKLQATGLMEHQNLIGMMSHFALVPLLALVIAGERSKLVLAGIPAALIVAALGGSRATLGFGVAALFAYLLLSTIRSFNARKVAALVGGIVGVAILAPLAISTLEGREKQFVAEETYSERDAFELAARMMLDDHPFGIGAEQYAIVANLQGYSQRAGVAWNSGSRSAMVHNFYSLSGAELGWLGKLTVFVGYISIVLAHLRYAWMDRRSPHGEFALGLAVSFAAVALHNNYEWVGMTTTVQYLLAIALAAGTTMRSRILADRRETRATTKAGAAAKFPTTSLAT